MLYLGTTVLILLATATTAILRLLISVIVPIRIRHSRATLKTAAPPLSALLRPERPPTASSATAPLDSACSVSLDLCPRLTRDSSQRPRTPLDALDRAEAKKSA